MQKKIVALALIILCLVSFIIFLNYQNNKVAENNKNKNIDLPAAQEPNKSNKITATPKEFSELILQISDLPANFTVKQRIERIKRELSESAINLGWEKGYEATYFRINEWDVTGIEQSISIYPIENISKALYLQYPNTAEITYDELSKPNIGEDSRAIRITENSSGESVQIYMLMFIKYNVYENLKIIGTATDYEELKDAAKKAEAKI